MSKTKRKNGGNGNGFLRLVAVVVAIAVFAYIAVVGVGFEQTGSANDIKLGLDLAGGVSITYQTVESNPSATDMSDTIFKLRKRAQTYSTEAEVYQEGTNRINVDIPDVSDANAVLEELGKPGSLSFRDPDGNEVLTGADVKSAEAGIRSASNSDSGKDEYVVNLVFTDEAAKTFGELTAANVGKVISIYYDGKAVSEPTVQEAITGGKCEISGQSSYEEAEILASTIRIGSLSLELEEIRSSVVGAKLGSDAIQSGLKAGAIGLAIIIIFMIAFYGIPGVAASLALILYVLWTIILLSGFDITLTLPGIAGIVLTIGMAVDANAIIFARIREELDTGKTVRLAIKDGFSKALSAILDGNITTLIAAAVLYLLGTGTVKGFATTLAMGTVLSMFTALTVTRFILYGFYYMGIQDPKLYRKSKEGAKKFNMDIISKKKVLFGIAGTVIAVGIIAMIVHGPVMGEGIFNYGHEFKGGTSTTITFDEKLSLEEVQQDIVPIFEDVIGGADVQVQTVAGTNEVIFKTKTMTTEQRESLEDKLIEAKGIDRSAIQEETISATISSEMKRDAILAVCISAILMLIYITIRFRNVRVASSTVMALIHDVFVVLTCYALFRWTVGNTFIACMLTVVGYSVNDTIVVFDRMRENSRAMKRKETLADAINKSISQVMVRCLSSSFTTLVMLVCLMIFGVSTIREFAIPLTVGIIAGFFSSVFLAGNMWHTLQKELKK